MSGTITMTGEEYDAMAGELDRVRRELNAEPASDYETLRRQFLSLRLLTNSALARNRYLCRRDDRDMRAALSVNAANVSAERDTNAMLTDLLEKAEAERDALHAEAEALKREQVAWRKFTELADQTVSKAEAEIEALRAENAALRESSQDVRGLAASLYQACGAYDMPERILDALSAAANGEPFTHMIDGLLPCVPPSEQDVRSLVEALEACAASLAWNCFGECRAVHAGPIMPAAMALDTARATLAAHRQAQPQ